MLESMLAYSKLIVWIVSKSRLIFFLVWKQVSITTNFDGLKVIVLMFLIIFIQDMKSVSFIAIVNIVWIVLMFWMISLLGMKPVKDVKEEWAIDLKEITRSKLVLILESANGRKFLKLFVFFTTSL
jgi:hypothetical protein